jgi:type 2 lantibiotic biosynthesis protein LanM
VNEKVWFLSDYHTDIPIGRENEDSMNKIAESVSPLSQKTSWYRALSVAERMAAPRSSLPALKAEVREEAIQKLQDWRKQASLLDDDRFAQRLAEDDMSEEDFLALLGESDSDLQERIHDIPAWLTELTQAFQQESEAATPASTDQQNTFSGSFLTCIGPLILYAHRQLDAKIGSLLQTWQPLPFDPQAILDTFGLSLLGRLSTLISRTMTLELHIARLRGELQGETTEERFQYFVRHMAQKEVLLPVLEEYPVLARLAMTIIDRWVAFGFEFLSHLCADWQQICATFSPQSDPGILIAVEAGAGDTHREGRSVIRLTLSSGLKLVYKPRSMAVDVHFQELLQWLNERGDHPALYCMKLLDRGNYGWSEFIPTSSCTSSEEVARFYERQGVYLALLYALDATDFHYENLIAMGEHPVLIDLEALFQPHFAIKDTNQDKHWIYDTMGHSVLRVGLLPQSIFLNAQLEGVDISGLGGKEGQTFPHPVPAWEDVGTDQARLVRKTSILPGQDNRPRIDEQDVNLLDYRHNIVVGFTKLYTQLEQHREELLAGPLARFMHDEIRIILRATNFYAKRLFEGTHPDVLGNTLDRECFLDTLWSTVEAKPSMVAVIAAERRDLHAGDIPLFTTMPDSYDIFASNGERIADFNSERSFDLVKKRLAGFGEQDLRRQTWFIEASLTTTVMNPHEWSPQNEMLPFVTDRADREQLVNAASLISERLSTLALSNDEMAHWLGVILIGEKQWMLLPVSTNLYDGLGGILLFLAYIGTLTENAAYMQMARKALYIVRQDIQALKQRMKAVGAFDGWGSFIYLFAHLGSLWSEPELLDEAEEIVELLPAFIEQDNIFEIMAGTAGCILALASLYQVRPSARIREVALLCGDHLLTHAQTINHGVGWPATIPAKQPLTGFSHGVAGIGYSLLVLAEMTGEERFRQTALSAMQYERSVFVPEKQNWPDLRIIENDNDGSNHTNMETQESEESVPETASSPRCMLAWCHGAPGIGLARLGSLQYVDDADMRVEIEAALQTTLAHGFGMNHSLCHGDLGSLETVFMAARVLGDARYEQEAERLIAAILGSINTHGWLTGIPFYVETPGLMTGLAGIGYELLRMAYPDRVPSILLLEPPRVPAVARAD